MSLLDQVDLDSIKAAYRADLPTPVDVLNLIHFKDEEAYKWYGVMVMPLLKAVGAEVGWMGKYVESFRGESRAEELLVVRYPNQRRFFALALNPYYFSVANPQRLKAVKRFEASFTHSPDALGSLRRSQWIVAVHLHQGLDALSAVLERVGGERVYQSEETSPIRIAKRDHPANTNPLAFKRTALYRFDSRESSEAARAPGVLNEVREAAGDVSIQLYQRVPRKEAVPRALGRLLRSV